ncbi:MAG: hypothetical protein QOG34_339 [Frankiaceae bacterium]|nr:hypothetical protein [Frankiaceae bacterium]
MTAGDDGSDGLGVVIPTITGGLFWPDWFGDGVTPGAVGGVWVGATTGPLLVADADGCGLDDDGRGAGHDAVGRGDGFGGGAA